MSEQGGDPATGLKGRIESVMARIRAACEKAGRSPDGVKLVAVSKTHPARVVEAALKAGLRTFGENYAQELVAKARQIEEPGMEWHFIGSIQRNKVKHLVGLCSLIHSVDSDKVLMEVQKRAEPLNVVQKVLCEVNLAGEASKSGLAARDLEHLLERFAATPNVECRGLMTMPPFWDEPEKVRPFFRELFDLRQKLAQESLPNVKLEHLSMGMSGDFETAVEEGATLVRVGTAIFGPRSRAL